MRSSCTLYTISFSRHFFRRHLFFRHLLFAEFDFATFISTTLFFFQRLLEQGECNVATPHSLLSLFRISNLQPPSHKESRPPMPLPRLAVLPIVGVSLFATSLPTPKSQNPNPKTQNPNPNIKTQNPKRKTRIPTSKLKTRNPKPETLNIHAAPIILHPLP